MTTTVIHVTQAPKTYAEDARYVAITRQSAFVNPYDVGRHGSRTDVLRLYSHYIEERVSTEPDFRRLVTSLSGKNLVSFGRRDETGEAHILKEVADTLACIRSQETAIIASLGTPEQWRELRAKERADREARETVVCRLAQRAQTQASRITGPDAFFAWRRAAFNAVMEADDPGRKRVGRRRVPVHPEEEEA